MKANQLDALPVPRSQRRGAGMAKPGYPTVIVPFAWLPNLSPAECTVSRDEFEAKSAPFGVSFTGMACAEPRLIGLAYAFEQATKRRVSPPLN